MTTYEFFKLNYNVTDGWIKRNLSGLCGDCEMIRSPKYDNGSDAYIVDDYILHIGHSGHDVIESIDEDGEVIENWVLIVD